MTGKLVSQRLSALPVGKRLRIPIEELPQGIEPKQNIYNWVSRANKRYAPKRFTCRILPGAQVAFIWRLR